MGLHIESSIEDYWHKDFINGTIHVVRNYIGANRWQQIDRYFYCTEPRSEDDCKVGPIGRSTLINLTPKNRSLYIKYTDISIYLWLHLRAPVMRQNN